MLIVSEFSVFNCEVGLGSSDYFVLLKNIALLRFVISYLLIHFRSPPLSPEDAKNHTIVYTT